MMISSVIPQFNNTPQKWQMPVRPQSYPDRSPALSDKEKALMDEYMTAPGRSMSGIRAKNLLDKLARFDRPYLDTVRLSLHSEAAVAIGRRHLFKHMVQTGMAFWAWPQNIWIEVIQGGTSKKTGHRYQVLDD